MNTLIQQAVERLNKKPSYLQEELKPNEETSADKMKDSNHNYYQEKFVREHAAPETASKYQYDKDTSRKVIRIPITLNQDKKDPSHIVQNFLSEKGYHIKDTESYRNGLAHKEITTGNPEQGIPYRSKMQPYKIGGLLQKHEAPTNIIHAFTHDPVRASGKDNEYDMVVSNHPHDVYGMSTGRGWDSCAQMRRGEKGYGGPAASKMKDEINNHTHVAYLVKRGGNYDTDSIARLNFKHHTAMHAEADIAKPIGATDYKPRHQTLVSEGVVYGQAPTDFRTVAEHEMGKMFPVKPDIYIKNSNVYNDNCSTIHVPEGQHVTPEHLDSAWKQLPKDDKSSLFQYVHPDGKYKSKKLKEVQTALKGITQPATGDFHADIDRLKYSTVGLDRDQVYMGIERNKHVSYSNVQDSVNKVMTGFDVNNSDHLSAVRTFSFDHPLRHKIYTGIEQNIPLVKTPQDFDSANTTHKMFGNRDHESLKVADDHTLGDDPIKTLGHAGVLRDANDFKKAYYTFNGKSSFGGNWYETAHRLAEDNVPNAHLALQSATHELSNRDHRGLATAYHYMKSPVAQRFYAQQLGHDLPSLLEDGKKMFARSSKNE